MTIKTPEEIARSVAASVWDESEYTGPDKAREYRLALTVARRAVQADRAQRPSIPERIVVATADHKVRTWIGGDTVADLMETINGYLADGYTPEELIIEGITR